MYSNSNVLGFFSEKIIVGPHTVVSYVGGRTFRVKILNCIFLVPLAPLGLERSRNDDFMTPEAQKVEKMLVQIGSYGHFT